MSLFRKIRMNEKSIEVLWTEYEKILDLIDDKIRSIENLDKHFYDARQEYDKARAVLVSRKEQYEAESVELKAAMDLLGGKGGS